ncbi:hypothetical protein CON18_14665 [Bacillus cereus]|nr:hypothetical protein CON18_14665 [Bacillus cereus]PGN74832.1 hypothetical protein CN963_28920 [Bacillus cereus]
MKKYLTLYLIIFCTIYSTITLIEFSQRPIMTELLQGILAPLSKWYIGIPIVLCSISFGICRIFQPKYSKIFPFIGIMIYMIYSLLGPMFKLYMKL